MILHSVFTFSAEVWGTVSDWVIITVTGISLYYLRKTLQSQLEVQQMQQQLANYEKHRFFISIKPKFNCTLIIQTEDFFGVEFVCDNSAALGTYLTLQDQNEQLRIFKALTMYDRVEIGSSLSITFAAIENKIPNFFVVIYTLFFKDIEGNCFKQYFFTIPDVNSKMMIKDYPSVSITLEEYNNNEKNAIKNL